MSPPATAAATTATAATAAATVTTAPGIMTADEVMRGRNVHRAKDLRTVGEMRRLNLSVILVSIAVSAGCLACRSTPLVGQVYLAIAAAMEIASLVAFATRQHRVFDFLHFRVFLPLMLVGVFVPGRMVAWAVLTTAMLFVVIWLSFSNTCIMLRPPRRGGVAGRWATAAIVIYASLRLAMGCRLPGWSVWVGVGYAAAVIAYNAAVGAGGLDPPPDEERGGAGRA